MKDIKKRFETTISRLNARRAFMTNNGTENICFTDYAIVKKPIENDAICSTRETILDCEKFFPDDLTDYVKIAIPTVKEINAALKELCGRKYSTKVLYLIAKKDLFNTTRDYVVNARFLKEIVDLTGATGIYVNLKKPAAPYYLKGKKGTAVLCGVTSKDWSEKETYKLA